MDPHALARILAPGTDPDVSAAYERLPERARDTVFGFEDEVAVVDIETTGFDPSRDHVIEVAAAVMRGPEIVGRYRSFVDPGVRLAAETVKLTGITDDDLKAAPHVDVVSAELRAFVGQRDLVAHNARFDRDFLEANGGKLPGSWIDTLELARIALPRLDSHRLVDLATGFGLGRPTHRAADDVEALCGVWRVLLCALDELPDGVLHAIAALSPGTQWPLRRLISHHAAARPGPPADLRQLRRERTGSDPRGAMVDADEIECRAPEVADIVAEFSGDGVAGRMYPRYERRDEQERMAEAVTRAFATSTHLAVEAGTGVGKSVAYLLPAARFAMLNDVTVGVATKTNSLTDQLVCGELPALSEALGGGLRFVALKGYENYPCLRKLERLSSDPDALDPEALATAAALLAWTAVSSWGDLDSINVFWRREIRARVACAVADCTHRRCRFYPSLCYLHGARRRAACAHVVVTNHALLFRGAASGGVLPPIRHWVVDEAHGAEAEARRQLSLEASHVELAAVLRALHAKGRGGLLDTLRRRIAGASPEGAGPLSAAVEDMARTAETCATLAESLFDFVKDLADDRPSGGYDVSELRVTDRMREANARWATVAGVGRSLVRKLDHIVERGRAAMTVLEENPESLGEERADLAGLLMRLAEQSAALTAVVEGGDEDYVFSVTVDRRRDVAGERMAALVLDVGAELARDFLPQTHSVVFCSATIATGDDFSHFARCVGLDRLGNDAWRSLRLASSYDFERQMAVYVPTDIAAPNMPAYLDDLERLLEGVHMAMGGSVLTLFTNRRDMEALYERLEPRLDRAGVPLLVQGRGVSRKRIRDEFLANETLSLFATRSFWEGFDAKGDTLRCVVVPKLPFGQVASPLLEERKERHADWWRRYYLPEAILELKQAAGRLIRSSADEGCLVIADVRVAGDTSYGHRFLEALPVRDVEHLDTGSVTARIAERFGRSPTRA